MADETVTRTEIDLDDSPPLPLIDPDNEESTENRHVLPFSAQSTGSSTSPTVAKDSPAEKPATTVSVSSSATPTVIKRGAGRPRADGMPNRTATTAPAGTPNPPFKRFESGLNTPQKPQALLNWITEIPTWARERLTMFVYRDWPVLRHFSADSKTQMRREGKPVEHNYIDKLIGEGIIRKLGELQDKYGAGDYTFHITDDVVEKRQLATGTVRENWRDIRGFPPSDRRIERPETNLELTEKANLPYISYLRGRGKLPEEGQQKGTGGDMAEVSAVKMVTDFAREVMNKQDSRGSDAAKGVDVMADAAKRGFEIIAESRKVADQSKADAPDPLDNLEKMVNVVDKLRPPQQTDSGMMGIFLTQLMEMNKTIMGVQNQRIEAAERRFDELKSMKERVTGETGTGEGNGGGGFTSQLTSFFDVATKLGFKIPGRSSGVDAAPASSGVLEVLPEILQSINGLVATGVQAWQTKVYADAVARGQVMGGVPLPTPPMIQPPPPPPTVQVPAQANPNAPAAEETESEEQNYIDFMAMITRPLLNHINRGLDGDQFAEFLIDMTDEATYKQIKEQGPDTFLMAIKSYPPIARELQGKDLVVKRFVDEFIVYDPNGEAEEEEEGAADREAEVV